MSRKPICRHLDEITPVPTSHDIGLKQVLLSNAETDSAITQIAKTILQKGEKVEEHIHPTMDEHYLFLNGAAYLYVDDMRIECTKNQYVLVPSNSIHFIEATSDTEFITIGVAID